MITTGYNTAIAYPDSTIRLFCNFPTRGEIKGRNAIKDIRRGNKGGTKGEQKGHTKADTPPCFNQNLAVAK